MNSEYYSGATSGPYATTNTNDLPDDFKYSVKVISCEPEVRLKFQRKVYSILIIQLLITFLYSLAVLNLPYLQNFMVNHRGIFILSTIISLVTCIWLSFAPNSNTEDDDISQSFMPNTGDSTLLQHRNSKPWYHLASKKAQFTVLMIFTFAEAYSMSIVTLTYDSKTILSALLITLVVVVGVTVSSLSPLFQVSMNSLTSVYYWLNWALWLMIGVGISTLFFGGMGGFSNLIFGWFGAFVFTIYLFIDTQLIFRKCYIDDEIKCCMMLYLDIINLFLSILRIMSNSNED
ncbi:hypothetical protein TPHA_0P01360 [Tetrapisispora phaffii CBS 4417]|uniref:Bax inhibitor 1 n=1 Tax=Tetrapisispora phaffii (strain ATCC 24235 / CBS 4417 / NBRC 1672 / NRRL Y-8282 / UCD 70-5) TaxID=1071381 RepID=G8C2B6_TETPH|nr:hypothetical protein TPHA_0P01360 [Tetrapisispora phaffii CBS 4417]CCE66294.1 hypothetical protein TPHA_0P01360 [Tetrapisispora phaffii CBS 4417]